MVFRSTKQMLYMNDINAALLRLYEYRILVYLIERQLFDLIVLSIQNDHPGRLLLHQHFFFYSWFGVPGMYFFA